MHPEVGGKKFCFLCMFYGLLDCLCLPFQTSYSWLLKQPPCCCHFSFFCLCTFVSSFSLNKKWSAQIVQFFVLLVCCSKIFVFTLLAIKSFLHKKTFLPAMTNSNIETDERRCATEGSTERPRAERPAVFIFIFQLLV